MSQTKEERYAKIRAWQKAHPEKVRATKKRFYATEKGKAGRRKGEATFVATGGRAACSRMIKLKQ